MGPTFTSLSTDEASLVKYKPGFETCNVMIAIQWSDSQSNALTRSAIPAPHHIWRYDYRFELFPYMYQNVLFKDHLKQRQWRQLAGHTDNLILMPKSVTTLEIETFIVMVLYKTRISLTASHDHSQRNPDLRNWDAADQLRHTLQRTSSRCSVCSATM